MNHDALTDNLERLTGRRLKWERHRSGLYLFDADGGILWLWSQPLDASRIANAIPPKMILQSHRHLTKLEI